MASPLLLLLLLPDLARGRTRLRKCSLDFSPVSMSALPLTWVPPQLGENCSLLLLLPSNASLLLSVFNTGPPCHFPPTTRCRFNCKGLLMAPAPGAPSQWVADGTVRLHGHHLRLRSCPGALGHVEVSVQVEPEAAGLFGLRPVLIVFGLGLIGMPAAMLLLLVLQRLRRMRQRPGGGAAEVEAGRAAPVERSCEVRAPPGERSCEVRALPGERSCEVRVLPRTQDAPPAYEDVQKDVRSSNNGSGLPSYAEAVLSLQPADCSLAPLQKVLQQQEQLLQRQRDLLEARGDEAADAAPVPELQTSAAAGRTESLTEHHRQLLRQQERMLEQQRVLLQRHQQLEERQQHP